MTEKYLEQKFGKEIKKLGGESVKFHSPFFTGMPDRIVLMPYGFLWWVEFKKVGGKLSERQKVVYAWLFKLGFEVRVLSTWEEAEFVLGCIKMQQLDAKYFEDDL